MRESLLDAAASVFAERGYDRSRLADIARLAGFTTGAVYSNFGSKHGLFSALLARHAAEQVVAVPDLVKGEPGPHATGVRAAEILADQVVDNLRWHQLVVEFTSRAGRDHEVRDAFIPHSREWHRRVAKVLTDEAERLGLRLVVDADVAAVAFLATRDGLVLQHSADPDLIDRDTFAQALAAVLKGLMTPEPGSRHQQPPATSTPPSRLPQHLTDGCD
ncbi:TetR/AcrR family transcriptional regulator [Pseudonocardia sp. C8]|uniref:TetR family transcriptional regulator n=1 Tax=Pseudonocardia sp. C8 TaxID=2762759 RepID=UPI00164284BC|nr:TetR/AcrR family transcriptional regulator [Pseudonocardia sp. C8]